MEFCHLNLGSLEKNSVGNKVEEVKIGKKREVVVNFHQFLIPKDKMILKLPQTRSCTNLKYSSANGLRKYDRGQGGKVPRDLVNDPISEVNMGM